MGAPRPDTRIELGYGEAGPEDDAGAPEGMLMGVPLLKMPALAAPLRTNTALIALSPQARFLRMIALSFSSSERFRSKSIPCRSLQQHHIPQRDEKRTRVIVRLRP
jgi:hypothetical protein